jgi:hypothetical protein
MTEPYKQLDVPALILEFQTATGCSPGQAQRWIGKYIKLTAAELIKHADKSPRDSADDRPRAVISANSINRGLGNLMIQGQRRQILPIINQLKSRLWTIFQGDLGNNVKGKLSMATLHSDYEDIVMASGDHQELYKLVYAEHRDAIVAGDYDAVEINLLSLDKFIQANRARPRRTDAEARRLDQNLRDAVRIKLLAEANDGRLVQVRKLSPFGREYSVGPNLQSVSKIVRHAALGKCHELDLKSAVFAWRLVEFFKICRKLTPEVMDPEKLPMSYTREYLARRDHVRQRLSREVFGDDSEFHVKLIKSAMTALGFGAKLRGGGTFKSADGLWTVTAIADVIRNSEARDKFITNEWVIEFVNEQNVITAAIVDHTTNDRVMLADLKSCPAAGDLFDSQGRLKPNTLISYLYQHAETNIRHRMIQEFNLRDKEPLLSVHDCVYTRHKPDVGDLGYIINEEFGMRQYLNAYLIEHTEHGVYTFEDQGPGSDLYEHARLTQEDENRAAALAGKTPQDIMNRILNRDRNLPGAVYEPEVDYNRQANDGSGYNRPRYDPSLELDDQGNEIVEEPIIIVGRQWPPAQGAPGQQ